MRRFLVLRCVQAGIGVGAVIMPVVATARASAASLAVNQACFVNKFTKTAIRQAPMQVTGSGYVPGDSVTITSSDGSVNTVLAADSSGAIAGTIGAPTPFFKHPGSRVLVLTATDYSSTQATITGATPVQVADLSVDTVPGRASPSRKVTWSFAGFRPGRYIYGHYLRHGREVARARFGRAQGDCGLLRVRARFFPGGHQRYRTYGLQFDDTRHYSKRSTPRYLGALV
ncbi:MAG: hypothetical protein QOF83_1679 [Solirubrobacteraceae bacterium]|nr:hypothetical protein [Solirubrobacteraceae bacterium]